jgi:hypothetical protein
LIGIVSPLSISGADGEPGSRSTKKLPSKMIRGRTLSFASLWIGRPLSEISIVMRAACSPRPSGSTFVTLPTLTPAIRTKESALSWLADCTTASILYLLLNGICLVNARYVTIEIRTIAMTATVTLPSPRLPLRLMASPAPATGGSPGRGRSATRGRPERR